MAKKISILIVDDERSVRESLCSWFVEDGYRVISAEDEKKALSLIESETFDIVLADIKIPGMDGLEMLKRIKTIRKEVFVIMITAFATVDIVVQALKDGAFREDLFYRLNVVNIRVPPLRERTEDIPLLTEYFIKKYCSTMNRPVMSIEPAALSRLAEFPFPGNIRELENMIERAIVVGNGKKICLKDLPIEKNKSMPSFESLNELEKHHVLQILDKYNWNISVSAKALKIDRVTLYNKIKKYNLKQSN